MKAKEFALEFKNTVEEIKANGTEAIQCDNLISYLNEIIQSPELELSEAQLEKYRAELQVWVEKHKIEHTSSMEMLKATILAGQNAIRSSFLLNGGSAVALLAFIGKISSTNRELIPDFANSLTLFVVGVLLVSLTAGFTYLSQWFYSEYNPRKIKIGFGLNISAILLNVSSYGAFIWGMKRAYEAFHKFV